MNSNTLLQNFDIDQLDTYEKTIYNDNLYHNGKVDALQIIINNVEGDHTQLSAELSEIADLQEEENILKN